MRRGNLHYNGDCGTEPNGGSEKLKEQQPVASELRLLCKIISRATPEFITAVTINNNRQNPVEQWNLHANDLIQLELQDKFRDDLGIYYERQENAFSAFSDDALEEAGITQFKAVQLLRTLDPQLSATPPSRFWPPLLLD